MIYYMHTETFFDTFLNNESDRDILKAQYVCVSTHIRRRDTNIENVICLTSVIYPSSNVFNKGTFEDMKDTYFEQLDNDAKPFLAELIRGSIEDKLNIILICTKKEWKLKYLKWLAEYIMAEFEYPVYHYQKYVDGYPLYEYDKEKVLKKTEKIITKAKQKMREINRTTKSGRKRILNEYKEMSKKELKALCIQEDLYYDGMSRHEMLDMLEAFL